jgi:hypothetical protein
MNLLLAIYIFDSFCKLFSVSIAFWMQPLLLAFSFSFEPYPWGLGLFLYTRLLFLYISENEILPVLNIMKKNYLILSLKQSSYL